MSSASNFLENKLLDFLFRGQQFSSFSSGYGFQTVYIALFTNIPNDSSTNIELVGGNYSRVAVPCNLNTWSGTQGAGTTSASSGTSGIISNNISIVFPTPSADWGEIKGFGIFDQSTGGNQLFQSVLAVYKTVILGELGPAFNPGFLSISLH